MEYQETKQQLQPNNMNNPSLTLSPSLPPLPLSTPLLVQLACWQDRKYNSCRSRSVKRCSKAHKSCDTVSFNSVSAHLFYICCCYCQWW